MKILIISQRSKLKAYYEFNNKSLIINIICLKLFYVRTPTLPENPLAFRPPIPKGDRPFPQQGNGVECESTHRQDLPAIEGLHQHLLLFEGELLLAGEAH